MNTMMKAAVVRYPGPPDVLEWADVETPRPGPGEVVIEIKASGVNNADLLQCQGLYPVPPDDSPLLGLECSGTISALGSEVDGWAVGDEVCALLNGGGYAQAVAVPSTQLLAKPAELSFEEAASLPEAACTVYSNIAMLARLQPGETFLVHGGTSGIGSLAIQWAKGLGAHVLTTAGTPHKVAQAVALGADAAINYREEDFAGAVRKATNGRGADVILDIVGAPYLARNIRCLAPDGRIVMIGGDVSPTVLGIGELMAKRGSVAATTLRSRSPRQKAAIVDAVRSDLWPMVTDGRIRPVVGNTVPMHEASRAHQLLAEGNVVGKVVMTV
ncbi:NAD(P)H-quinone oxidoreductase [Streptomyces sp. AK02-04a]|uniref:NAD(P)H-quinone oxidoreductase n=1 Tax=Streptomyces sp. AK02-04a TaxID=3028649 RepID=UPI0029CA5BF1|nr:NAD(P)H-quinone oxidoreductase [Streptomyces sp. AK02-04a]